MTDDTEATAATSVLAPVAAEEKPGRPEKPEKALVAQPVARADGAGASSISLAAHPRATHTVARAKAVGGLVGFALGGYLSLPTHTVPATAVRALLAGMFCYVAVWGAAVFLWRRIVVAELRQAEQQLLTAELARLGAFEQSMAPRAARGQ